MTIEERLEKMLPEATSDERAVLIELSKETVLNRRYPFGYPDGTEVEPRYVTVQLRVAMELYNRQGAEGQTSHTENGISRIFDTANISPNLLKSIVPMAKVPGGDV